MSQESYSNDSSIRYMESQLAKLDAILRKIGIDRETMSEHNQMIRKHVKSFMDDMIAVAASRQQAIIDSIESLQASISKLAKELQHCSSPSAELTERSSRLEHEKRLSVELKDLTDACSARLEKWKKLNDQQLKLSASYWNSRTMSISQPYHRSSCLNNCGTHSQTGLQKMSRLVTYSKAKQISIELNEELDASNVQVDPALTLHSSILRSDVSTL